MKNARKKLNSKQGATIVLALLFFLICAVIGGIVLASASANAGRLSHIRQEQQAYLNLGSAAKLIREEIAGTEFTHETEIVTIGEGAEEEKLSEETIIELTPDGAFAEILEKFATEIAEEENPVEQKADITITPDAHIGALGVVKGNILMETNYNVTIVLMDEEDYAMTIYFRADVTENEKTEVDVEPGTRSGREAEEAEGEAPAAEERAAGEDETHEEKTKTTEISVRWDSAIITKGGTV